LIEIIYSRNFFEKDPLDIFFLDEQDRKIKMPFLSWEEIN